MENLEHAINRERVDVLSHGRWHTTSGQMRPASKHDRIITCLLTLALVNSIMAQRYTIKVRTFQKFEHALGESISSAISKGVFASKGSYKTSTTYIFDLDRRIMRVHEPHRPMVERPIVHIFSTGEFFVVEVWTNTGNVICKFYRDDHERLLFTMEYDDGDCMAGFFTGKIRWKREEQQVRPPSARAVERLERQSRYALIDP